MLTIANTFGRVNIRIILVLFLAACCCQIGLTNDDRTHFELTPTLRSYYDAILQVDWDKADSLASVSKEQDPANALVYLFDNYSIVTQLLIQDKELSYNKQQYIKDDYLRLVKKGEKDSPYYRYVRAEILLQWSVLSYKYDSRFAAMRDVWSAFRLLEQNIELYPNFISNYRSIGILHAVMGTMPFSDNVKWLIEKTSGMSGTIEEGMSELNKVIAYGDEHPDYLFHEETKGIYAYLQLHLENDPIGAWAMIKTISLPVKNYPLAGFVCSSIALRTGHPTQSLAYINEISEPLLDRLPYVYFLRGKAQLYLGKKESRNSFRKFLETHKGESYRLAAYQKIAWSYFIEGNGADYKKYIDKCLSAEEIIVGEDKDAHQEAKNTQHINRYLLEARILFDAQQFNGALAILKQHPQLAAKPLTTLEYFYRLGRVLQGLNEPDAAIESLTKAYLAGVEDDMYYACNAALQIGMVYEKMELNAKAIEWFDYCLDMNPDAYRKILHLKAKAGKKRLNL